MPRRLGQCQLGMLLMKSYLIFCSVRLGVLIICAFATAKSIFLMILIFTENAGFLFKILAVFEQDEHYGRMLTVHYTIDWLEENAHFVLLLVQFYNCGHLIACAYAAYGAYKLKGLAVVALFIFELIYLIESTIVLVFCLTIIKKIVNLGTLILLALTGSFYLMLVTYDCAALLAFIQIVRLVHSARYKQFYGNDPFNPVWQRTQLVYVLPQLPQLPHKKQLQYENEAAETAAK